MKTDKHSDLSKIRHSASHIMAEAVLNLFPDTLLGIGPATEEGFYYDMEFKTPVTDDDLVKIEEEMKRILAEGRTFERSERTIDQALSWAKDNGQTFKVELIKDLAAKGETSVSFYTSGPFMDLCAGPHVENSSEIGAVKMMSLAGAYWKGS